jgi:DUF4097 and DUF4098 domain-containing protein YvlB
VTTAEQRKSIFSGLLLIFLGVLFLLYRFEPGLEIGFFIRRFWPVLIILWGLAKLVDHLMARRSGERAPILAGGEAALLIVAFLALAGLGFADYIRKRHPDIDFRLNPFAQKYTRTDALPAKNVPAGAHILVQTTHGNISVHVSAGNELHVTANKTASDSSESEADEHMGAVKTVIEQSGDAFRIYPAGGDSEGGVDVDLDVEVPKSANVTAITSHGDISLSEIAGAIDASTKEGDVEIHDAGSDVNVTLSKGDLRLSNVAGNVRVTGHGTEIDVSDVKGDAAFEGEFYGPVRVRNVAKTTHYVSQRSDLTLVHMTGRMEMDSEDLQISDVAGAAKLITHNKDVNVENVGGSLDIADSHGDIKIICLQPPTGGIGVADDSGEVDLTLPSKSNFEISAVSRGGDISSDFEAPSLQQTNDDNVGKLNGRVGSGGPKIQIVTSYGTISLRKGA